MTFPNLPKPVDPEVQTFWQYWLSLPRTDGIPHLRDYLATVPAALQKNVAVADVFSEFRMAMRRFGAGLVKAAGADLTGIDALSLYSNQLQRVVAKLAWACVNRPCGYTCVRRFQTSRGRILEAQGIVLPIATDSTECKSMLLFTNLAAAEAKLTANERLETILDVQFGHWIDLGKGVPNFPT